MNRALAVSVIKEILTSTESVNRDYIALMPPDIANNPQGYEVHIKTTYKKDVLNEIVNRNKLARRLEDDLTIIYEPLESSEVFAGHSCSVARYCLYG